MDPGDLRTHLGSATTVGRLARPSDAQLPGRPARAAALRHDHASGGRHKGRIRIGDADILAEQRSTDCTLALRAPLSQSGSSGRTRRFRPSGTRPILMRAERTAEAAGYVALSLLAFVLTGLGYLAGRALA
ncbi:MAG: hypothetical protein WC184_02180 [Acidimicrobiia bacterium]